MFYFLISVDFSSINIYFQLVIDKWKAMVRFGMMHLMATNLCVLLVTAITETAEDFRQQDYNKQNLSEHQSNTCSF